MKDLQQKIIKLMREGFTFHDKELKDLWQKNESLIIKERIKEKLEEIAMLRLELKELKNAD